MIAAGHAGRAVVIRLGDPRAPTLRLASMPASFVAATLPPRVDTRITIPVINLPAEER